MRNADLRDYFPRSPTTRSRRLRFSSQTLFFPISCVCPSPEHFPAPFQLKLRYLRPCYLVAFGSVYNNPMFCTGSHPGLRSYAIMWFMCFEEENCELCHSERRKETHYFDIFKRTYLFLARLIFFLLLFLIIYCKI